MSWKVIRKGKHYGELYVRRTNKQLVYISAAGIRELGRPTAVLVMQDGNKVRIEPASPHTQHARVLSGTAMGLFSCIQLARLLDGSRVPCEVVAASSSAGTIGLEFTLLAGQPTPAASDAAPVVPAAVATADEAQP